MVSYKSKDCSKLAMDALLVELTDFDTVLAQATRE